ncbi:Olfactory receptor 4K3 [Sciurus carolinensis]|uniref:Olfactory receptor n=1 Tax=Sciurus carolinensis TaxID=30640 RepID=A0AA41MMK1_SCICA|nr:Olfactory receptor 4K3 [Sciurus carolinensis]
MINTTKRFDKSEMFWREAQQVLVEELKFLAETSRLTETPLSGKGQTKGGLGLETQELRCLETLKRKFKKDVGVSDRNLERPDNSNSPNSVNGWSNKSVVTEFILLGLSSSQELQLVLFLVFSVFYGAAVLGNILIILTVITDSHLHSPMYFLLRNLSFIDVCQVTFATPKMIADFLNEHKTITFQGCMSQIFFLHVFGGSEMVLLVAMAYDRYIAICRPLHYLTIMSRRVCAALVGVSWAIGILHSASHLAFTVDLPFCGPGPNKVDNFFCDLPLVIKLACLDTYVLEILMLTNSGLLSLICFLLLLVSYTVILATVHHQASGGMSKALSTLSAHITVVVLFFGPLIFIYIWPFESFPIDKFISVFFTVFTPFLNPMIYTLRNKDVKEAMKKLKNRMLF